MPESPTVFTKSFKESVEKKQQWNTFKKRIAINNDSDYEETISSIRVILEPIYYANFYKEDL